MELYHDFHIHTYTQMINLHHQNLRHLDLLDKMKYAEELHFQNLHYSNQNVQNLRHLGLNY